MKKDLSNMTNEERRQYQDKIREEMRIKNNELDLLKGNIARLCVTDSKEEAYKQFYFITYRAGMILDMTLKRISEQEEGSNN